MKKFLILLLMIILTRFAAAQGDPVCFRFNLTEGSLYAFWVSPDASGASYGYVGAGGPGFTGPIDTVGRGEGAIGIQGRVWTT